MTESAARDFVGDGDLADRLDQTVREKLAAKCRLLPDAVRMTCQPVVCAGKVCALHFALRGPREVLLTAVWDAKTGVLWCYDSRGTRFSTASVERPRRDAQSV